MAGRARSVGAVVAVAVTLTACSGSTLPAPNPLRPEIPAAAPGSVRFELTQRRTRGRRVEAQVRGRLAPDGRNGALVQHVDNGGRRSGAEVRIVDGTAFQRDFGSSGVLVDAESRGWRQTGPVGGTERLSYDDLDRRLRRVTRSWPWTGQAVVGSSFTNCRTHRVRRVKLVERVCFDGAGRLRRLEATADGATSRYDVVAFDGSVQVRRPQSGGNGGGQ